MGKCYVKLTLPNDLVSIRTIDLFLEANDTFDSKGVLLRAVAQDVITQLPDQFVVISTSIVHTSDI